LLKVTVKVEKQTTKQDNNKAKAIQKTARAEAKGTKIVQDLHI
jgi:hypothetical protein